MQKFDECLYLKQASTTFSCCQNLIKAKWHSFIAKLENSTSDPEDSEDYLDDEVCYHETEASLLLKKDNIAVIKTSHADSYYLLKLSCQPYITEQSEKNSYNHTFPAYHKVIKGHYLEIFKETMDGDVYY